MIAAFFGSMLLFVLIGVPIAFALQLSGMFYLLITHLSPMVMVAQRMARGLDSFTLMAVPLFIAAGYLMEKTSIAKRLVEWVGCIFNRVSGGVGIITVVACAIFAALTGSGYATVAAIGAIMMSDLVASGYPKGSAAGLLAAAGALGPIIPPSIPMIIYGATMGVSISDMFVGGVVPGLLIAAILIIMNVIFARKWGVKKITQHYTLKEFLVLTRKAFGALLMPVIVLGGIYGGIFTPTEAAGVAVIYGLILGFCYRDLTFEVLLSVLKRTLETSGMIMFIVSQASLFAMILTATRAPQNIAEALIPLINGNTTLYLLMLSAILFVLGALLETVPIILIVGPILVPVGIQLGIDPLHLGVVFCINLVVGYITPPYGGNLFTAAATTKQSYVEVVKGVFPFMIAMMIFVLALAFLPVLTTWLP
ncbi:MAG: TRAP transporter large permease subunit [Gracilibacteraceae bacterium]|jgi:C4-dicarboxylate transporter DctM subunit|nr:TRAP transporter large permease subunit [Gracilibacteraceae bacterium]